MKINVTKATEKEIKKFNRSEWPKEDIEHFGRTVKWTKKKFIYKAMEGEKIVGTMKFKHEMGIIHISEMIVAKDKRRKGVGRRLMEKAEAYGKRVGAHKIFLITADAWKASNFYKKLGFKKTADLPKYYLKKDFSIYSKLI